ncbi:MAG: hypothetical protein Q8880_12570 [Bacteroidota bacterium]|nr:hypothetical protein [Bacteroidota bacterium]
MILPEEKESMVEDYLMGRLDLLELEMVEKEIITNPEFYKYVKLQRNMMLGIQEFKKQELKDKLNKIDVNKKNLFDVYRVKFIISQYSVAASVIIILAITFSILVLSNKATDTDSRVSKLAYSNVTNTDM